MLNIVLNLEQKWVIFNLFMLKFLERRMTKGKIFILKIILQGRNDKDYNGIYLNQMECNED